MAGTIQLLECRNALGHICWVRPVYISDCERYKAYAAYLGKKYGEYTYTFAGRIHCVEQKPETVPHWFNY